MNNTERIAARERFGQLLASPAIQRSIGLKSNRSLDDGDIKPEFNPGMLSKERVDAVIQMLKSHL